jgi:ATP-dependent RNA helicase RhlE
MPQMIFRLATSCMKLPVHVEVAPSGSTVTEIDQEIFMVRREAKLATLERVLQDHAGTVLVFSRTKYGAIRIARVVKDMGHRVAEIHSERTQAQRQEALNGFKSGKYRILIATDIAARGIDVKNIEVVINFDLPDNAEDYVHRIGRTGRAGKRGLAISFATIDQKHELHCIERLIRKTLVTSSKKDTHPDVIETYKFSGEENTRSALIKPKSSVRSFGPRRFGRR